MGKSDFVAAARGEKPADLLLKDCRLVNVFNGRVQACDLAVKDGLILGWGDYRAAEVINLGGAFAAPSFIDGHMHVESSMVALGELSRALIPRGTCGIVTDYHEIANVLGVEGIEYMIAAAEGLPLEVWVMLPSCVPATPMETAGATLGPEELRPLLSHPQVLGLGEMMNFPGVVSGSPETLAMLEMAGELPVDGHAPGLSGLALNAYAGAGISSDHECSELDEAAEKLARGMFVMIREGSTAKDLERLLPLAQGPAARRCLLVTDDRNPADLLEEGHLDSLLRKAVSQGADPVEALRMVTLNPAERFGLRLRGALVPGYRADLVVLEDLAQFRALRVMKGGRWVAEEGELIEPEMPAPPPLRSSVRIAWEKIQGIGVRAEGERMRVIGLIPDQIITRDLRVEPRVEEGLAVADTSRDLVKLCVFERHHGTGNVGTGFVHGFGLREGALASTVAHDSHNVVAVGVADDDILAAVRALESMGGGQVVVREGKVAASLPLPMAGLMSEGSLEEVAAAVSALNRAARDQGCKVGEPFMALSFLALPVIPELKMTDRGLFDVGSFSHVPLFVHP